MVSDVQSLDGSDGLAEFDVGNDKFKLVVLGLFGQNDEEYAVPGDADDEVAVPLRVRLRVDEDVPIDDVVLDVEAAE